MRNFRATFTTAAFSTLLILGIQHSDFGQPDPNLAVANTIEQANDTNFFAIRVANYEETMQWYRENLNATVEGEWQVPQNPDAKLAYLNVYGFRVKVLSDAKLPTNSSQVMDSHQYQINTSGLNRAISLQVKDLSAVINSLEERGVNALIEISDRSTVDEKVAFVKDNNGNKIELVQSI